MSEEITTTAVEEGAQEPGGAESLAEQIKAQIDLDKFDKKTAKVPEVAKQEDSVEELKRQLEQERSERQKVKDAFDKAARERAIAEKAAREAKKAATAPNEELDALKKQLADMQRESSKKDLSVQLGEYGIGKDLVSKFVSSIYNEDTGSLVIPDLVNSISELVDSVRESTKISTIDEYERAIAAGQKPKSVGGGKDQDSAVEHLLRGAGVSL